MQAFNGLEALRALNAANFAFDVVLLDIQMPEMDGFSTIRAIRDHEQRDCQGASQRLAVFAMSAGSDEDTVRGILCAGCDEFLAKPFRIDAFDNMVRKHVVKC